MKKNLWFVFVALAMLAVFAVTGCRPTTPSTPTPTPATTPAPTPAPDKECPKVVSTVVSKAYDNTYGYGAFNITIKFNEPITSTCVEDLKKWTVEVTNSGRVKTPIDVNKSGATIGSDNKSIIVKATVSQTFTYAVTYSVGGILYSANIPKTFEGLICSTADADKYVEPAANESTYLGTGAVVLSRTMPAKPTVADTVSWKLKDCFIYDELGNGCCTYSGEDCCKEELCVECVTECPLGTAGTCP